MGWKLSPQQCARIDEADVRRLHECCVFSLAPGLPLSVLDRLVDPGYRGTQRCMMFVELKPQSVVKLGAATWYAPVAQAHLQLHQPAVLDDDDKCALAELQQVLKQLPTSLATRELSVVHKDDVCSLPVAAPTREFVARSKAPRHVVEINGEAKPWKTALQSPREGVACHRVVPSCHGIA
jgi:hypothetical protein